MASWETGLFECASAHERGPNCFAQHCCCQPCVVSSALKRGGIKDGDLIGISLIVGGNSLLDEVAGYVARRRVAAKYGIEESELRSLAISCCCSPLSNFQVVNTVVVRERLTYGCAHVKEASPRPPARNARMRR